MKSIDIFPWNVKFNTGILKIDEQHEVLVSLLNQLASHVAFQPDAPKLSVILGQLVDYTVYHFQTEEAIWHEHLHADPAEISHIKKHEEFVAKIFAAKEKLSVVSDSATIEELLFFLTRWLTTHILEDDRYLVGVVLSMQSGMSMDQAKQIAREQIHCESKILTEQVLSIYENFVINTLNLMRELNYQHEREIQAHYQAMQMERLCIRTVNLVTELHEMRDPHTVGHAKRVAEIAVAIGREMGLDEQRIMGLRLGGCLHDIGKTSIPIEILGRSKKLGALEYELIKSHAMVGYDVLKDVGFPWPIEQIALQHHERMDGSGYPNGLTGSEILLEARIVAVAEVVESMTLQQTYRPALGLKKALAEIERGAGTEYDPIVVYSCLNLFRDKKYKFPDDVE
jgi:hemerythrin-like metal-binding protein/putative nucleotidyltransferase with HDIG domain